MLLCWDLVVVYTIVIQQNQGKGCFISCSSLICLVEKCVRAARGAEEQAVRPPRSPGPALLRLVHYG